MNLGLVFQQGDPVLIAVFLMLVAMSVITWTAAIVRYLRLRRAKAANAEIRPQLENAQNWQQTLAAAQNSEAPYARLVRHAAEAEAAYRSGGGMPYAEYMLHSIHHQAGQQMRGFEGGMTALATIGATAPFIGLFGTVWGIYNALINIGTSGQMSIAAVATPIGEALVATALGLFVAIPAVLAYNFLVRGNKTLGQDLHAYAHTLHMQAVNRQKD
ncbi:MotA/TolQ/ExbB proton channel family protein [Neisseria leonii]|uniref:Biopolymer transport protein ExbB n=1 Tax=Neisseria leonii TaxID=2995413 RepID=A0A9X4E261_9NEIS|nr:MotA/TolQ/ExbB proton channel family protein [Neisseria sp. 51.81]MDD9328083.1 MotA/TolQ/ExbB proton channel family protein [Neisseria sp. 51.81]